MLRGTEKIRSFFVYPLCGRRKRSFHARGVAVRALSCSFAMVKHVAEVFDKEKHFIL